MLEVFVIVGERCTINVVNEFRECHELLVGLTGISLINARGVANGTNFMRDAHFGLCFGTAGQSPTAT